MVKKMNKKVIIVILACVLVIGLIIGVAFLLMRSNGGPTPSPTPTPPVEIIEVPPLAEEQYELLMAFTLDSEFRRMDSVEKHNAVVFLEAMKDIGFVENRSPGESGVPSAVFVLKVLEVGRIDEFTIVAEEKDLGTPSVLGWFLGRIENQDGEIFYMFYDQTWGLGSVHKDSEDGERIYSPLIHIIIDNEIRLRREHLHQVWLESLGIQEEHRSNSTTWIVAGIGVGVIAAIAGIFAWKRRKKRRE